MSATEKWETLRLPAYKLAADSTPSSTISEDDFSITKEIKTTELADGEWCCDKLGSLLRDTATHDVVFKTSDGTVGAHRLLVAAGSPVFHAMLCGSMKESVEKVIELLTVNEDTLNTLLTFIYTGRTMINSTNCLKVLEAARYFNIASLEQRCITFIISLLSAENCCQIAVFSYKQKFESLLSECYSFMYTNGMEIITTSEFKNLPSEIVLTLCKSSELFANEVDLFLAVVKWCKHQGPDIPADVVNNILQQIRYPLMSVYDLIEKVRPTNMADQRLYTAALEYCCMPEKYNGPPELILKRSYHLFNYRCLTDDKMKAKEIAGGIHIIKTGPNGWNASCAVEITSEMAQSPLKFDLRSNTARISNSFKLVPVFKQEYMPAATYTRSAFRSEGIDCAWVLPPKAMECSIEVSGSCVIVAANDKSLKMRFEGYSFLLYLCVNIFHQGDNILLKKK